MSASKTDKSAWVRRTTRANNQQLPFSDLFLTELTKGATAVPTPELVEWIKSQKGPLTQFKKFFDDDRLFFGLKYMLNGSSNYSQWMNGYKEQSRTVSRLGNGSRVVQAKLRLADIASRMKRKPIPGSDMSNSIASRKWIDKMLHNVLLTVLMDLQSPQYNFFENLLGGASVDKWYDGKRVRGLGDGEDISESEDMPTTHGPPPPKNRKKNLTRRLGDIVKSKAPRPKTQTRSNRTRNALPPCTPARSHSSMTLISSWRPKQREQKASQNQM